MTVVGTTTRPAPLSWPHQRKLAVVGNRVIAGYWKDDTTGRFAWSTGGAFTPYTADIAGGSQGSIAVARDAAGTWRALTAWIQIGNVAGRTDLYMYVMAGSFSADLSTLSWGPAVGVDANWTCAPDVALAADGTGLFGVVTYGIMVGGNAALLTSIRACSLTISATGALTVNPGIATIGGPWYGTSPQVPVSSAAIDPASKNVGVLYSAGLTGPGMGTLFRRGTYNAGTTVWDRPAHNLDQGVTAGSNGDRAAPTCQWDATRSAWVMGGVYPRPPGVTGSQQRIWQRDAADTTTLTLVDTGTGSAAHNVANGPLLVDPVSGDILLVGGTHTGFGPSGPIYLWRYTRPPAPADIADQGVTLLVTDPQWEDIAAVAVEGAIHVLYDNTHLTSAPYTVNYLRVGLPVAPNAPHLLTPTGGIAILVDQPQRFSTQFSSDTPGDSRSAIEVERRAQGATTATSTGWVPRAGGFVDFPAGTFVDAVTYEWRSRDKGATGLVGPWSGWATFVGLGAPADLTITGPANNSAGPAVLTVTWAVSNQDAFQVQVVDDAGQPTGDIVGADGSSDTGTIIQPDQRSWQITFIASGVSRHIRVRSQHVGLWGDWRTAHYTPSFVLPGLPVTTAQPQDGYMLVSVANYAGEGDLLEPPGVNVPVRSIDFGSDVDGNYS